MHRKMVYAVKQAKQHSRYDLPPSFSAYAKDYLEFELFRQTAVYINPILQVRGELGLELAACAAAVISLNEHLPGHQRLLRPHGKDRTRRSASSALQQLSHHLPLNILNLISRSDIVANL